MKCSKLNMLLKFLFFCVFICVQAQQFEGESCVKDGVVGRCTNLNKCQSAIQDIRNRKNPQICGFANVDPIVCCLDGSSPGPTATTTKRPTVTTTTEYIPPVYDYVNVDPNRNSGCEPIPEVLTAKKTGQKAFDKCIEYQEQLVYPCVKGVALTGDMSRTNRCHHNADELIIGGTDASQYEFPHMVMVGYGDKIEDLQWLCGGALISEKFVLTAGHCIASRDLGPITYVTVGALRRSDASDRSKIYKVKNVIKHPQYLPPSKYNDIALIETENTITLDQFVVPACLHVGDNVNDDRVQATGWGLTQYNVIGSVSSTLQKVILNKFTTAECSAKYQPVRLMRQGFDPQTQLCYGDKQVAKDTCQGDSGGPIQIKNKNITCMYTVVGVTSFGRACGFVGEPGIYTRVANYVPWIESIICSFNGTSKVPNICCLEEATNVTAILGKWATTSSSEDQGLCPLLGTDVQDIYINKPKAMPETSKSWKKCLEYQAKIKLPCKNGKKQFSPYCAEHDQLILGGGGVDADEDEFPHMALLTYGKEFMTSEFGCGGSLISEKYILTAGHCTFAITRVPVSFAVFGVLNREEMYNSTKKTVRGIKKIIKHPEYKPPVIYHDIALLELDKAIVFSLGIRPACLQVENVFERRAYATGWGLLGYGLETANVLQNVPLWRVEDEDCKAKYKTHRKFPGGLDNTTQVCYGDDGEVRDTCSGDSGGPVQVRSENAFCMHLILAVTSFGKFRCGQVGSPGVYTKVPHYVPWIESIVWP